MKNAKLVIIALFLALASGCSHAGYYRSLSSGIIGCPRNEVEVDNITKDGRARSWEVSCRGRTFYCAASDHDVNSLYGVSCKEGMAMVR